MIKVLSSILLSLCLITPSYSLDSPKWGNNPELNNWFKSLRNKNDFPCCDYADGLKIEDPEYKENEDGTYEVYVHDKWRHVPIDRVINPPNRPVDYAIVWHNATVDTPYCFMPGMSY